MSTNALLKTASAVLVVAVCCVAASAQVVTLSGNVTLKRADGTQVPVSGAVVDIYRTDIPMPPSQSLTDASGNYTRAGIPFIGTYAIAVSAPGAAPDFRVNVRYGQVAKTGINFVLAPGDGRRLTLDELKEMENKTAEIEATNKKIVALNEAVQRALDEGNAALTAATGLAGDAQFQKYDEAVAHYDEALKLRPDEVVLLTNKSVAIRARGAARYNAAITGHDDAVKAVALADFTAAAELAQKAVAVSAAPPAMPDEAARAAWGKNRYFALAARAEALRLVADKVEPARREEAFKAYEELVAVETDPAKRIAERVSAAKIFVNAGEFQRAVVVLRKIVADAPANPDANYYLGSSLVATSDKASMKEGAIYLKRFLDVAPPNHPKRQDAEMMLDFIKAQ